MELWAAILYCGTVLPRRSGKYWTTSTGTCDITTDICGTCPGFVHILRSTPSSKTQRPFVHCVRQYVSWTVSCCR
ncbi:hypothetical protein HOY82DRAFT_574291 [Tuber indicum]|nr:hypothetical protein HOY82DRAFT_574291 [Tuber indicum]